MSPSRTDEPLVSVVMPARNAAGRIVKTLESLKEQTYNSWELILTDDGSTDETAATVRAWAAEVQNLVHIVKGSGEGPSAARNRAVESAQGSLLAFLDADDVWATGKLSRQVQELTRHPEISGVTCDYNIVAPDSTESPTRVTFNWSDAEVRRWALLEGRGPALCSTLMIRASAFRDAAGFDENLWNLEDVDLALRLLTKHQLVNLPTPLCDYLVMPGQNHQDSTTVLAAVEHLNTKESYLSDGADRRRISTNVQLLVLTRAFRQHRSIGSLWPLIALAAKSPVTVGRTVTLALSR